MDATAKYLMKEIGPAQTIWARYTVQAILVTVLILPKINIYGKTKYPKLQFLRSVAVASIEAKQNIAPIISKIGKVFDFIFF